VLASSAIYCCASAVADGQYDSRQLIPAYFEAPWAVVGQNEGYLRLDKVVDGEEKLLRLHVRKEAPYNFYPQIFVPVPAAVQHGSRLRVHFKARSKDDLFVDCAFEQAHAPYDRCFTRTSVLTRDWQEFAGVFTASKDLPDGWGNFEIHVPRLTGEIEIADLTFENWGQTRSSDLRDINQYNNPFAGKTLPASWWEEADKRIDTLRKRDLILQVLKMDGKPAAGVSVSVNQVRQTFKFGTCVSPTYLFDSRTNGRKYRKSLLTLFNCVTPENSLKWIAGLWEKPGTGEQVVDWCHTNQFAIRGHHLFCPDFSDVPEEVKSLRGNLLSTAIENHVKQEVNQFDDKVYIWDVVNEGVTNHEITDLLGQRILVDCYNWARQTNSTVQLSYNDYDILNNLSGANDGRRAATHRLIQELIAQGAPITVLGIQSHMHLPLPRGQEIWRILDEWAQFGQPLEITEYDLACQDEQLQSDYLREFLTAVYSHPSTQAFVMWGFWDGSFFAKDVGYSLFTLKWRPRMAEAAYEDMVLKRWRTNETLTTDAEGKVKLRAFVGSLRVQATYKKQSASATVDLDASSPSKTVSLTLN